MHAPLPNRNEHITSQSEGEVRDLQVREISLVSGDKAQRALLDFGFKAFAHAVLASEALKIIESNRGRLDRLEDNFIIRDNPLSFSIHGLKSLGFRVPRAVLEISPTNDSKSRNRTPRPQPQIRFCSPKLLAPLITPSVTGHSHEPTLPKTFGEIVWTRADLLDRAKMGAVMIFARQLFNRAYESFERHADSSSNSSGALEDFASYLNESMRGLFKGESRNQSLALGERMILALHGLSVPSSVNKLTLLRDVREEDIRLPKLNSESILQGLLEKGKDLDPVARRSKICVPVRNQSDWEALKLLGTLRQNLISCERSTRLDAVLDLKSWSGNFSPVVANYLSMTRALSSAVYKEELALDYMREILESGKCFVALELVDSAIKDGSISHLKSEALMLRKAILRTLNSPIDSRTPDLVHPDPSSSRRLADLLHIAFMQGSDAEVFTADGLRFSGKLACYVPDPSASEPYLITLIDHMPKERHELELLSWRLRLSNIVKITFFLYPEPPPQDVRARKAAERAALREVSRTPVSDIGPTLTTDQNQQNT
jgi:hypothetical protein